MAIVASGQLTLVDLNDSKQLLMFIGSSQQRQVIYNPNAVGVLQYVPNYSTVSTNNVLTPQLFIAGTNGDIANTIDPTKTRWYVQTGSTGTPRLIITTGQDATDYTIGTGTPKTLTIKNNVLATNSSMTYICEMDYLDSDTGFMITAKAEYEIVKVTNGSNGSNGTNGTNGANAIMGILSNDSHTLPADSAGTVSSWAGATSTLTIYEGTNISPIGGWTINQVRSNVTVTEAVTSPTATVTAMTAGQDTGYVEFTATKSGYGTVVKRFTLTKSKSGAIGASATSYWLTSSHGAISKNASGNYVPASITFTAKSQTGAGAPAPYSGRYKIYESTDGTAFNLKTTSASDKASEPHTPSVGIKAVKVELYQAGGTAVLLDEQIIPVISDGSNQISAVVWTPDGNTVKNSTGSLKVTCDLYNGSTLQTSGVTYKWYFQDPTANTDTGGGIGWRLIDATSANGVTNYTTNTITVPATAFVNVESYKCVATYLTIDYRDVATLIDVSDPFMVTIVGINTFKNGVGTTKLTAKIYQAGVEVDQTGTGGYTYTWYLYDNNNVKMTKVVGWANAGFITGKTIDVDGVDVTQRGNIICEVSK